MTFKSFKFTENQIIKYFSAANKDFKIAKKSDSNDVKFRFAYDALLKLAISVCAKEGLRVDSNRGHHKELIDELATVLKKKDIKSVGNKIRTKRNYDLYSGGLAISNKDAQEIILWIEEVFNVAEAYLKGKNNQNKLL